MKLLDLIKYLSNLNTNERKNKLKYDYLEDEEKKMIDKKEYDEWNFEEEEMDEDDYYYDDDLGNDDNDEEDEEDEEED